ncbi:GPW/gp25 family protein [Flavilitoribacter nigricans]|uniref:IraD/Gp25-like domain-containing protein n=1 Tax=Flavilitoribacter nigricans (strain ATCC 23147 / DSM 23189 / NBRC 102662 / NCIMB 1420 / SS-2) TaxID=1122177 RepID=A0A2D0MZD6_FLAN2|nr:GPW/gp25 family protein [Flavilitoribacter nigricans]PHN01259.1 hypothetical protein CRP01_37915 [Flavilitoribacter nigricans DSM 23189 = NBRC 102662]
MDQEPKFLGRGWAFPPGFSQIGKEADMVFGVEDINQSLHILMSTQLGERVMLSDYGCNTEYLVFEPLSLSTQTLISKKIEAAVALYEARIILERIDYDMDRIAEGLVLIHLYYKVVQTNTRFNFVYPFYLNEGTEVSALLPVSSKP